MDAYNQFSYNEYANGQNNERKGQAASYAYKLSDQLEVEIGSELHKFNDQDQFFDSENIANHTYGFKTTFSLNKNLDLIAGHKWKEDKRGMLGNTKFMDVSKIDESSISISQVGFSSNLTKSWKLAGNYKTGQGNFDISKNAFIELDGPVSIESYAFELKKSNFLSKNGNLGFSYLVPPHISSGEANFILPTYFGGKKESFNFSESKIDIYQLSYTHQNDNDDKFDFSLTLREYDVEDDDFSVSMSYIINF